MDVKFYENKVNLNWKAVLKSIIDVSEAFCLSLYNLHLLVDECDALFMLHGLSP